MREKQVTTNDETWIWRRDEYSKESDALACLASATYLSLNISQTSKRDGEFHFIYIFFLKHNFSFSQHCYFLCDFTIFCCFI